MSLDQSQIAALQSIINEENTQAQTFEAIASSFHQFFNKHDFFKIGCALVTLLQNKELIPHATQRLVCIFLLYDMYRSDTVSTNPFAPVFIHLLSPPQLQSQKEFHWHLTRLTPQDKYFLSQLLKSSNKELLKRTATQILQMDASTLHNIDISGLQVSVVEKQSEMPFTSKIGLPCILSDMEMSRYGFDNYTVSELSNAHRQVFESLLINDDAPYNQTIRPEFIRLAPPLHYAEDELVWLNPAECVHDFLLEDTTNFNANILEIKQIMAKAFKQPLPNQLQQKLSSAISADPELVHHTGLTPNKLPSLVENNPLVAIELLLKLVQSTQISEYVRVLINMEMSVHSLEVVNRLTTTCDVPPDFLLFYVSNCINTCENIKDKHAQNRSVRLLCVFLQSLIRNKILDVKDLAIEVQPFCIEFSRISEANALFRLLKQMENDSNTISTSQQPQQQQQMNETQE